MTKQEITDKILEIVCNKFIVDKKEIPLNTTVKSYGANSLDLIEILADIERDFKINIPNNIALRFSTSTSTSVADYITSIIDYIDMIINKNNSQN
jgi:acyl carrier protein